MRSLERNKRDIYYSVVVGEEPIIDEYGNDTLEIKKVYSSPSLLRINVSANSGKSATSAYGEQSDYTRNLCYVGNSCPITEGAKIWLDADLSKDNDYKVVRVADSKNGYLIVIQEVAGHEQHYQN